MRASWQFDRRTFLRGVGVAMALPLLDAMAPAARAAAHAAPTMRMVCIGNPLGMLPQAFFPQSAGAGYELPEALEPLAQLRDQFTVFSNLDHDVKGGHSAVHSFLSGIKDNESAGFADRNISLDQRAAEHVGSATRFPSLVLAADKDNGGELQCELSWTRNGVNVPPLYRPTELFRALFIADDDGSRQRLAAQYELSGSILDAVGAHARQLSNRLGQRDRQKLEEYFTSVREVERKLSMSNDWLDRPKPTVDAEMPADGAFTHNLPVFYDLLALALETDSTRVATLAIPASINTADLNLAGSYHGFSHHGKAEGLQRGLLTIETFQTRQLARFLDRLESRVEPDGGNLLERTMVLFGSGMGNGSSHSNKDLPVLLAGGGFPHGEHKVYPAASHQRVPLCNLFTSMLQRFGVEVDRFNKASGTLTGLEVA